MVAFQALTWESRDTDDEHMISIFGKTEEGKSVCLTTAFTPYFFIKLPPNIDTAKIQRIYNILDEQCKDSLVGYSVTNIDLSRFHFPKLMLCFYEILG